MTWTRKWVWVAVVGCLAGTASANNLEITNVSLGDLTNGTADIQFDMSWSNSWRESWTDVGGTVSVTNWDAVWFFAKFRRSGGLWKHAMLAGSGHAATGGTIIDVPDDGGGARFGAFVYRTAEGSGPQNCNAMSLRWDYAASGLTGTGEVDIAVLGMEMVYIPEGPFHLGSGGIESGSFYRYPDTDAPFLVTNEDEIVIGTSTGSLYYTSGGDYGPIPAAFPKGYRTFYCMKYEATQGQYTDFLNLMDPAVAITYFPNAYGLQRHTIANTSTVYTADAPDDVCNYLNADRMLAWLDWSGLRPMTELEFEKICRGQRQPWPNEYAWGNATYVALDGVNGDGTGADTATPANANVHVANSPISGPVRAGIFATAGSTREQAGAAYYGVMEMSGSMYEFAVSVTRPEGRMFTGQHGDGDEYTPIPSTWQPAPGGRAYMLRGGACVNVNTQARVSDRSTAESNNPFVNPSYAYGCRGVRTAP